MGRERGENKKKYRQVDRAGERKSERDREVERE